MAVYTYIDSQFEHTAQYVSHMARRCCETWLARPEPMKDKND